MTIHKVGARDLEITAIGIVYDALRNLDPEAQRRVLDYVALKIGALKTRAQTETYDAPVFHETVPELTNKDAEEAETDTEGISPVALKSETPGTSAKVTAPLIDPVPPR